MFIYLTQYAGSKASLSACVEEIYFHGCLLGAKHPCLHEWRKCISMDVFQGSTALEGCLGAELPLALLISVVFLLPARLTKGS